MIWPVYEFRPTPDFFTWGCRRYNDGKWTEDDGKYDIAFIGNGGAPICLYVSLPYQHNIICSWLTTHWTGAVKGHPRGNPWHYALREGETKWGGGWNRDDHLNERVGRAGMTYLCAERGCANGRHVEFHADDKVIVAGLLRERESKKRFEWPRGMRCMYCEAIPPVYECALTAGKGTDA